MELFEHIRETHDREELSIRELSRRFGVRRRTVREALMSPVPPACKPIARVLPVLEPWKAVIDGWLAADKEARPHPHPTPLPSGLHGPMWWDFSPWPWSVATIADLPRRLTAITPSAARKTARAAQGPMHPGPSARRANQNGQASHVPNDPDDRPEVPDASLVAAWLVLEHLDTTSVPTWASWWLVDGQDGEALRQLAGESGSDPFDVRDALLEALDEMNLPLPTISQAARQAFDHEALMCLHDKVSEHSLVRFVESVYIKAGYADAVLAQPLGATYGLDDEWRGGWGRTDRDLRDAVRSACREQLRSS